MSRFKLSQRLSNSVLLLLTSGIHVDFITMSSQLFTAAGSTSQGSQVPCSLHCYEDSLILFCIFILINGKIWRCAAKIRDFYLLFCLILALYFFQSSYHLSLVKSHSWTDFAGFICLVIFISTSIVMNHRSESGRNTDKNSSCTTARGSLIHSGAFRWREHWPGDHSQRNGSYGCTSQLSSEVTGIVQLLIIST